MNMAQMTRANNGQCFGTSSAYLERAAKSFCHRTVLLKLRAHLFKVLLKLQGGGRLITIFIS